jgi:DNA-directed RNA polymerase subunit H (RpoH/RPB5)
MRIWDANTTHKTRLPRIHFKDLANNKATVAQGKLLLKIIKNTLEVNLSLQYWKVHLELICVSLCEFCVCLVYD